MGSRLTFPPYDPTTDEGGEGGIPPNNIYSMPLGISRLSLGNITEFTKYEVEYGFSLDLVDKIQMGRQTILWDQVSAVCTSHEIEESENLGEITSVTFEPYVDGNDIGIEFDNQSGEIVSFQYNFVNKFNLTYSVNPAPLINWDEDLSVNSTFEITNLGRDVIKTSGNGLALIQSIEEIGSGDFNISFNVNSNPMVDAIVSVDGPPHASSDIGVGGLGQVTDGFRFEGALFGTYIAGAYSNPFLAYSDTDLFEIEKVGVAFNLIHNGVSVGSASYNDGFPARISMFLSNTDKIKNITIS